MLYYSIERTDFVIIVVFFRDLQRRSDHGLAVRQVCGIRSCDSRVLAYDGGGGRLPAARLPLSGIRNRGARLRGKHGCQPDCPIPEDGLSRSGTCPLALPENALDDDATSPVVISRLEPAVLAPGITLEVVGAGFLQAASEPIVTFPPGIKGAVKAFSDRMIFVIVPQGARSGDLTIQVRHSFATTSVSVVPPLSGTIGP